MRLSRTLTMVALLLLVACQGRESVTGSYGSQTLSGVVTMAAGMPNGSPAGVRVAVGGTGMSAVLGPDGQFAFFNVPGQAQLIFSRGDLNATLRVPSGSGQLAIELNSNSASLGRHHSAATAPFVEIEGTIASLSLPTFVVHDEHGKDVTVTTDSNTIIRKGDQKITPADLKAGDHVEVRATVSGTTTTAQYIEVEGSEPPGADHVVEIEGVVQSASATQIVVNGVTIVIDAHTVIRRGDQSIMPSDLKVGDRVHVKATVSGSTTTALLIEVQETSGDHLMVVAGKVTAIGTNHITVSTEEHGSVTVNVDSNTKIMRGNQTIAFSDIKVGDEVVAMGTATGTNTMLAKTIEVGGND